MSRTAGAEAFEAAVRGMSRTAGAEAFEAAVRGMSRTAGPEGFEAGKMFPAALGSGRGRHFPCLAWENRVRGSMAISRGTKSPPAVYDEPLAHMAAEEKALRELLARRSYAA